MEYAEGKWEEWGRDDEVTLPEAVAECIVLNNPDCGPFGIGLEMRGTTTEIIDQRPQGRERS